MQINKFLKIIKKRLANYKNVNNNCPKLNEVIFELDELVNIAKTQISQSNNGWISVDDDLPYCYPVFDIENHPNRYCLLQIITKDNMLHTAVFLEMKIPHYFHGEKLFWLCNIENLNGKFVIYEISDDFLEINEVKYWQPLPKPPKE